MTTSFTNSLNYTRIFTDIELIDILTNLNATNTYFANGLNDIVYIRISAGNLLLLDLNDNINRKLFELYSIQYDVTNVFSLKFIHNDNALEFNINDALISVGFAGVTPIASLESRYMLLYTNSTNAYLQANALVKNAGQFAAQPAELNTIVGQGSVVVSQDLDNLFISSPLLTPYYTAIEVDTLLTSKSPVITTPLSDDVLNHQIFNGPDFIKLLEEGNNISIDSNTDPNKLIISTTNYSSAEIDTLLNGKMPTLVVTNGQGHVRLIEPTTPIIKSLIAGANITLDDNLVDSTITVSVSGLDQYYTKTEIDVGNTLQDFAISTKQNALISFFDDIAAYPPNGRELIQNGNELRRIVGSGIVSVADGGYLVISADAYSKSESYTKTEVDTNISNATTIDGGGGGTSLFVFEQPNQLRTLKTTLPLLLTTSNTEITINADCYSKGEVDALVTHTTLDLTAAGGRVLTVGDSSDADKWINIKDSTIGSGIDVGWRTNWALGADAGVIRTPTQLVVSIENTGFSSATNGTFVVTDTDVICKTLVPIVDVPTTTPAIKFENNAYMTVINASGAEKRYLTPCNNSGGSDIHIPGGSIAVRNDTDETLFLITKTSKQSTFFGPIVYHDTLTSASDRRIKRDIETAPLLALCSVFDKCDVKTYKRIDLKSDKTHIGFIAQDIEDATQNTSFENIIGESVVDVDNEEVSIKTLDYSRLVCVLWGKVKQLEHRIDVLEAKKRKPSDSTLSSYNLICITQQ